MMRQTTTDQTTPAQTMTDQSLCYSAPMRPPLTARPRLAPGCRLTQASGQKTMLSTPTGPLPVLGPSLQIIERCDGQHTVAQIVAELQKLYAKAKAEKVAQDVLAYLELLHAKRALEYEPSE